MTLVEKINSLPKYRQIVISENPKDESQFACLCLRFSHSAQKWIFAYGRSVTINAKFAGIGDTPTEAVDGLIAKIREDAGL